MLKPPITIYLNINIISLLFYNGSLIFSFVIRNFIIPSSFIYIPLKVENSFKIKKDTPLKILGILKTYE